MGMLQEMVPYAGWIAAALMIAAGALLCVMGYRLIRVWTAAAGCAVGFCAGFLVGRMFLESLWLCIGIGVVLAVLCAVLAFRFHLAGIFLLCAALMFLLMKGLFHGEEWWIYAVSGVAAAAAGVTGIYYVKAMVITATAAAGGFWVVSGLLFRDMLPEGWDAMGMRLLLMLLLTGVGVLIQCYDCVIRKKKQPQPEEHPEKEERRRATEKEERRRVTEKEERRRAAEKKERRRAAGKEDARKKSAALEQKQRHERRRQNRR